MDIGDLVFLGILLASGVGSVIGAAKKKNKGGGLTPKTKGVKPTASPPDTGLSLNPPQRAVKTTPRTAPPKVMPQRRAAPETPSPPFAASTPSSRSRRRNRWREYVIMKEVLGPPKGSGT
ncbi:MAG: hypothetical protein QGI75_02900 [Phycisphaerales bacterium]|jgi:hypothetical protein|nr:hypothetical protein [Phycisphaerales bacterium]MDP6891032.1 hypothetical protein [Phycisphaerales bacterium]